MPRPTTLLIGVSGGADSTALLFAIVHAAKERPITAIVVHVDHGLRANSSADARHVREMAAVAGLRCLVLHAAPRIARGGPLGRAGGLEQVARDARYHLLARAARRVGAAAILIAHTLDDQAETVLLRLLRGAGPTGLAAMRPVSRMHGVRVVRPMLGVTRDHVLQSLAAHHATPVSDDSNADLTRDRNWIRREILPALKLRYGANLPQRLARTARLSHDAAAEERRAARVAYCDIATENLAPSARVITLDAPRLASYSRAVQRSVVRHALRELAGTLAGFSLAHVTRIVALAAPPTSSSPARISRPTDLPQGLRVTRRGTDIILAARELHGH